MNILYIIHQFFPLHFTGTERHTLDIANHMQRLGHYVTVLTYEPEPPRKKISDSKIWYSEEEYEKEDDFQQIDDYIKKKEYQVESIPVISLKHYTKSKPFEIFQPKLEKYLEDLLGSFHIVHFTHPARLATALWVCKKLKIPTVLTLTDNWLLCDRHLVTVENKLCNGPQGGNKCMSVCKYDNGVVSRYNEAKFFFDNIDRVFAGTNFVRRTFWENEWTKKIELNNFAVDYVHIKEIKPSNDELVFAFIGSFTWNKGLHVLLDAFKKVSSQKIKLKIYGATGFGNLYAKDIINSLGEISPDGIVVNDKRIEFCGTFDYKELPKIMKDISIIIIPSVYREIYPLVMQTAFAYKKPIIASNIGGMPEVIHDKIDRFLFPPKDENELSKIIQMVADDPKIINNLKKNITPPPRIEEECLIYENAYTGFYSD